MARRLNNRGFTLLEMCAVLLVIAALSLLSLSSFGHAANSAISRRQKLQALTKLQVKALIQGQRYCEGEICFNGLGNVNMARTLPLTSRYSLILHLGAGKHEIR